MKCQRIIEQVTAHYESALHPHAAQAVGAHLEACDGCAAYYEQTGKTIRLLALLPPERTIGPDTLARLLAEFRKWSAMKRLRT